MMANTCKHCEHSFEGNYCNNCGQKDNPGRIRFSDLIANFSADFMSSESRLAHTFGRLTTNPGKAVKDFISGRRIPYYRPIAYFIFAAAIYISVRNLLDFDPIENQAKALGQAPPPKDSINIQYRASQFMSAHINTFAFFWVMMLAFFAKLFYRKSQYHFAEYLTLSFYTIGQFLYFSTLFVAGAVWIDPKFFYLTYLFQLIYIPYALVTFHEGNPWWLATKGVLASAIGYLIYVVILYSITIFGLIWYDKVFG